MRVGETCRHLSLPRSPPSLSPSLRPPQILRVTGLPYDRARWVDCSAIAVCPAHQRALRGGGALCQQARSAQRCRQVLGTPENPNTTSTPFRAAGRARTERVEMVQDSNTHRRAFVRDFAGECDPSGGIHVGKIRQATHPTLRSGYSINSAPPYGSNTGTGTGNLTAPCMDCSTTGLYRGYQ